MSRVSKAGAALTMERAQQGLSSQPEDDRLKGLWAEGLASGPGRFNGIDAIKAEARRRHLFKDAE